MTVQTNGGNGARASGQTLAELLTTVVRRLSDGQLVGACVGGLVGVVAVLLLRPEWWRASLPLICLGALGAWGIAEREGSATGARRAVVVAVRTIAIAAAAVTAIATVLLVMQVALGTWIS